MKNNHISSIVDINKLKNMAKNLKSEMETYKVSLKLSESYEIISKIIGFKNYNTAKSIIENDINKKEIKYTIKCKNNAIFFNIVEEINNVISSIKKENTDLIVFSNLNEKKLSIEVVFVLNSKKIVKNILNMEIMLLNNFKNELINHNVIADKVEKIVKIEEISINRSLSEFTNKK